MTGKLEALAESKVSVEGGVFCRAVLSGKPALLNDQLQRKKREILIEVLSQ